MKKIIYKNNNLVFDKSSLLQKNLDQAWDELISNYNNWIANFPQSKIKNKNIINKIRFICYFLYSNLYYKDTTRDTFSGLVLGKQLLNKQALSMLFRVYENKLKNF